MDKLFGLGFFGFMLGLMFVIAPLGIWNRIIKMHKDQKAAEKKAEEQRARIAELLEYIAEYYAKAE